MAYTLLFLPAGAAASYSITMAAGQMRIALRAVGTAGTAEAMRGGFDSGGGGGGGSSRAFCLVQQGVGDTGPTQVCGKTALAWPGLAWPALLLFAVDVCCLLLLLRCSTGVQLSLPAP